jgi:hypothetical protein
MNLSRNKATLFYTIGHILALGVGTAIGFYGVNYFYFSKG